MKIFLIGMPGSGKTTLGKQLATHLQVEFVDLDTEIERAESKPISDIFLYQGEDHFRIVEAKILREWATHQRSFVMATGGGAPCFHHGISVINEYGISVFLDCPVEELAERVKRNRERPLLLATDEKELRERLERMRQARLSCYLQAKIVLPQPSLSTVLKSLDIRK